MSMSVFYDGLARQPRLDHPEGIAIAADGSVWCGGEAGQIYRISPDGGHAEQVASTGGFLLGLAFDAAGTLYMCDLDHRCVWRLTPGGTPEVFAREADGRPFRTPNAVAVDSAGRVYVSDSFSADEAGPGIYRFQPDGAGELWCDQPFSFANGIALAPDESGLYVVETFRPGVTFVPIRPDGGPGPARNVVDLPGTLPDGVAAGPDGSLYIGCYEPSQVLHVDAGGVVSTVAHDPTAHTLCHPTNVVLRDGQLLTSNLGRWHLTAIDIPDHPAS